jgi:Sigma-70, region 4
MPSGAASAVLDHAPHVYGAACTVCTDPEAAAAVTERVLAAAVHERSGAGLDRGTLVEEALVLGVRVAPSPPFAAMPLEEREVITLARLGGCSANEIAGLLAMSVEDVKAALLSGLERLAQPREQAAAG